MNPRSLQSSHRRRRCRTLHPRRKRSRPHPRRLRSCSNHLHPRRKYSARMRSRIGNRSRRLHKCPSNKLAVRIRNWFHNRRKLRCGKTGPGRTGMEHMNCLCIAYLGWRIDQMMYILGSCRTKSPRIERPGSLNTLCFHPIASQLTRTAPGLAHRLARSFDCRTRSRDTSHS